MAWRDLAGPLTVSQQPSLGESLLQVDVTQEPVAEAPVPVPVPVPPSVIPVIELHMQPVVERLDRLIVLHEAQLAWLRRPSVWQRLWAWLRAW